MTGDDGKGFDPNQKTIVMDEGLRKRFRDLMFDDGFPPMNCSVESAPVVRSTQYKAWSRKHDLAMRKARKRRRPEDR